MYSQEIVERHDGKNVVVKKPSSMEFRLLLHPKSYQQINFNEIDAREKEIVRWLLLLRELLKNMTFPYISGFLILKRTTKKSCQKPFFRVLAGHFF